MRYRIATMHTMNAFEFYTDNSYMAHVFASGGFFVFDLKEHRQVIAYD